MRIGLFLFYFMEMEMAMELWGLLMKIIVGLRLRRVHFYITMLALVLAELG